MFFLILSPTQGIPWFREIGWFVGFVYLLCAAMRLARFNVITNPLLHPGQKQLSSDFTGLPVPAAAATVASVVLFLLKLADSDKSLNRFALGLPFLMLLVGILMMSTIRYPSGKKVDLQTRTRLRGFAAFIVLAGLLVLYREVAMLGICLCYIFFRPDPAFWRRQRRRWRLAAAMARKLCEEAARRLPATRHPSKSGRLSAETTRRSSQLFWALFPSETAELLVFLAAYKTTAVIAY